MSKGDYLADILRSPKTIFTTSDIALLWGEQGSNSTRVRLNYYVKRGDLYRIRRGLYAKDKNYNKVELATRIFIPSYISFETVLAQKGVIFQYYSQIFAASYLSRSVIIDEQTYSFRQISKDILINPAGIEHKEEISIATKERAFLDTLYNNTNYHFDNMGTLDWNKIFEILPIYHNKSMTKTVEKLYSESHKN